MIISKEIFYNSSNPVPGGSPCIYNLSNRQKKNQQNIEVVLLSKFSQKIPGVVQRRGQQ